MRSAKVPFQNSVQFAYFNETENTEKAYQINLKNIEANKIIKDLLDTLKGFDKDARDSKKSKAKFIVGTQEFDITENQKNRFVGKLKELYNQYQNKDLIRIISPQESSSSESEISYLNSHNIFSALLSDESISGKIGKSSRNDDSSESDSKSGDETESDESAGESSADNIISDGENEVIESSSTSPQEIKIEITPSQLERIMNYYSQIHPNKKISKAELFVFGIIGLGSTYLYAKTGTEFSGCPNFNFSEKGCNLVSSVRFAGSNSIINFTVTVNTTHDGAQGLRGLPAELKDALPEIKKSGALVEYALAFATSLPFAMATISKSFSSLEWFDWAGLGVTQVTSVATYKIAVEKFLEVLLDSELAHHTKNLFRGKNNRDLATFSREKYKRQLKMIGRMQNRINDTRQYVVDQTATWNPWWLQWDFDARSFELPQELQEATDAVDNGNIKPFLQYYLELAKKAQEAQNKISGTKPQNDDAQWKEVIRTLCQFGFAIYANIGISPFDVDSITSFENDPNLPVALIIAGISDIALISLLSYYTGKFGREFAAPLIISILTRNFEVPIIVKRFPKLLTLLGITAAILASQSYATTLAVLDSPGNKEKLEKLGFGIDELESIIIHMVKAGAYGASAIFNFKNAWDFLKKIAQPLAEFFGSNDAKKLAKLDSMFIGIRDMLGKTDFDQLLNELALHNNEDLMALTGMGRGFEILYKTGESQKLEEENEEEEGEGNKNLLASEKEQKYVEKNKGYYLIISGEGKDKEYFIGFYRTMNRKYQELEITNDKSCRIQNEEFFKDFFENTESQPTEQQIMEIVRTLIGFNGGKFTEGFNDQVIVIQQLQRQIDSIVTKQGTPSPSCWGSLFGGHKTEEKERLLHSTHHSERDSSQTGEGSINADGVSDGTVRRESRCCVLS